MTMIAYSRFYPYIQPFVPSCPNPSLDIAIRNAVIEFCDETLFLADDLDTTLVEGESTYEVDVPTGHSLTHIQVLYANGIRIAKKTPSELEKLYGVLEWRTMPGQPQYYTQFNEDEVILCPVPDGSGTLTGRIAMTPTRASTTCDARLLEMFPEVIAQGALSRVYMQPDQPYTNAGAALVARQLFNSGMANAKAYVRGGMSASTPQRVRFQRLW